MLTSLFLLSKHNKDPQNINTTILTQKYTKEFIKGLKK